MRDNFSRALLAPNQQLQKLSGTIARAIGQPTKRGELIEAAAVAAEIPARSLIAAASVLGVRTQKGQWRLPG